MLRLKTKQKGANSNSAHSLEKNWQKKMKAVPADGKRKYGEALLQGDPPPQGKWGFSEHKAASPIRGNFYSSASGNHVANGVWNVANL